MHCAITVGLVNIACDGSHHNSGSFTPQLNC